VGTTYYANLNYVCNERCVFCAADMANGALPVRGHPSWVTAREVEEWLAGERPGPGDHVLLAGGEPTIHKELLPIVRLLSADCNDVTIFTNGLRLADRDFALATVEAGITRFEIALYGAGPDGHDAVTRRPGSFERTLKALAVLGSLRAEHEFWLEVRLLVSRQCAFENPGIVRVVSERAPGVDGFSINRLLLSRDAEAAAAAISYEEARPAINEAARLTRELGYGLVVDSLPLCVFEGENADWVRGELGASERAGEGGDDRFRYLDPYVAAGQEPPSVLEQRRVLPDPCLSCDLLSRCRRVEAWYVKRFGYAGLRPIRHPSAVEAAAGER
jgi:uncharacterized Fe-S cluster-containing radical SAM superfamily protein